jgi:hypothetical protein
MRSDSRINRRRALIALAVLPVARFARAGDDVEERRTGGPYVPTPQIVVDEMLRMGRVGPQDFVIDLGSGDGVIVLTAAQKLGARGMGVDIDPELVQLSNAEAKKRGIADRVSFHVQDVFKADLGKATVVTLYLLPGMMVKLRQKIYSELKPGTRVVSHDYHFDDWRADEQITWDVPEKEKVNGVPRATVYVWYVPARVSGRWQVRPDGTAPFDLILSQHYQDLQGEARGRRLTYSQLRGMDIMFAFPEGGVRHLYKGRVTGERMEGVAELAGGRTARWTAARVKG